MYKYSFEYFAQSWQAMEKLAKKGNLLSGLHEMYIRKHTRAGVPFPKLQSAILLILKIRNQQL